MPTISSLEANITLYQKRYPLYTQDAIYNLMVNDGVITEKDAQRLKNGEPVFLIAQTLGAQNSEKTPAEIWGYYGSNNPKALSCNINTPKAEELSNAKFLASYEQFAGKTAVNADGTKFVFDENGYITKIQNNSIEYNLSIKNSNLNVNVKDSQKHIEGDYNFNIEDGRMKDYVWVERDSSGKIIHRKEGENGKTIYEIIKLPNGGYKFLMSDIPENLEYDLNSIGLAIDDINKLKEDNPDLVKDGEFHAEGKMIYISPELLQKNKSAAGRIDDVLQYGPASD